MTQYEKITGESQSIKSERKYSKFNIQFEFQPCPLNPLFKFDPISEFDLSGLDWKLKLNV